MGFFHLMASHVRNQAHIDLHMIFRTSLSGYDITLWASPSCIVITASCYTQDHVNAHVITNTYTHIYTYPVNREIFTLKRFSPVAWVAKIKRAKIFQR